MNNLKNNEDKYHLSFVEECILNKNYQDWTGGRVEIFIENESYNIDEIRFLTPKNKAWEEFREKFDGESVNEAILEKVKGIIKEKFYTIKINQ